MFTGSLSPDSSESGVDGSAPSVSVPADGRLSRTLAWASRLREAALRERWAGEPAEALAAAMTDAPANSADDSLSPYPENSRGLP
jgi:hypothetical protein